MGYTTTFTGRVAVTPALNAAEVAFLNEFAAERHDDYEIPGIPRTPWCQWVPTDDGTAIEWDGGEKFVDAAPWMRFLIDEFLRPSARMCSDTSGRFGRFTFDHVVNGTIEAQGKQADDRWDLVVVDNAVTIRTYEPEAAAEPTDAATLRAAADVIDAHHAGNPIAAALRVVAGWAGQEHIAAEIQVHIGSALAVARSVLNAKAGA